MATLQKNKVPQAIQRTAGRALALHRSGDYPLTDVYGVATAEALESGTVPITTVAKLHRFFRVNSTPYQTETEQLRTEQDSALARSWVLHGAEAGKRWADKLYRKAVKEGQIEADPVVELFSLQPQDIIDRFQADAWRWEYDLTPTKAARFVAEYMRSTGNYLDIPQAFGTGAIAVGNAVYRRFNTPNPFEIAYKKLMSKDTTVQEAAQRDIDDMGFEEDFILLDEALKKSTLTARATAQATKLIWTPFVAYFILAVERPDLISDLNSASVRPPLPTEKVKSFAGYNDTVNTYVTYFHPEGSRYMPTRNAPKFKGLSDDLVALLVRAWKGSPLPKMQVQKSLAKARQWTVKNKLAGNLFFTVLADWKKSNWQGILDSIPLDSDVRSPFAKFASLM